MTDREFAYKQLSENSIKSGQCTFVFESFVGFSLCDFSILKDNTGKFGSRYLVDLKDNKIIVRIYTTSGQKRLILVTNNKNRQVEIGPNFLESPIQDFLYLLSNEQWVVEDIELES